MLEIICYTTYLPEGTEQYITFLELLLNDNLANGKIICPEEVYSKIGDINTVLTAKQNYEFLLRAVQKYPLKAIGISPDKHEVPPPNSFLDDFRTDCYIVGKYQQELLDTGYFNPVVETLLHSIAQLPEPQAATQWLEKMISRSPEYYEIDDNTRPILIYRGDTTCYNQLNTFADELAKALSSCHQAVEIFDAHLEGNQALTKYINQRFKAIIGIQSYIFSIKMQDKITNLHDLIIGPKFNMVFDHPALLKEHITAGPKDYYLLTHDRNYINFVDKYFKNIKGCFHFTPAGIPLVALPSNSDIKTDIEKIYNVSFIGTYYNYRHILTNIKSYDRNVRFLATRFLNEMKHHPNQPTEIILEQVLEYYQIKPSSDEFTDLLFQLRHVSFSIMYYYREKIIHTLLDAGIEIHVFGESWSTSPFANHPCLIRHPQVNAHASLLIMQQSRISLNIMSWHKDGFTERIANAMLNHSLVVSDKSSLLGELFENNQDLVLFELQQLDTLPTLINSLLRNPSHLFSITQEGYRKALQNHQWLNRAKQFLSILDTLN